MAYPPPQGGPYLPGQSPLQEHQHPHGPHTAPATASPVFIKPDQRQQAPVAQFIAYIPPQQQLQPQTFAASPSAPVYPPRPGSQLHPAPPNVALQYGAIPAAPAPYYNTPSRPDMYASPHPQYQAPPPPRPLPRSQSQPKPASSSPYPQIQIRPPPPSPAQRLSTTTESPTIPQPQPKPRALNQPAKPMRPNTSTQPKPAKARTKCEKQSIDYQVLLLSLADEYFDAAHSQGTVLAASRQGADIEQYHKLIATGLGCLEAVLKVGTKK